ncbi:MAG: hypothetical protein RL417_1962 [Pseudomonadota bacterium]|jgi:hypothetical protein
MTEIEETKTSARSREAVCRKNRADPGGNLVPAAQIPNESSRLDPPTLRTKVARAFVSDHGPRLSPAEVALYRSGQGSTVCGELLCEHVAAVVNSQLNHYSLETVNRSLWRFDGPRELVALAYELTTQYGSLEQFHRLAEIIDERCGDPKGPALYCAGDTSLGSVLRYLGVNKSILPIDWKVNTTGELRRDAVVVLDEVILATMRSDSNFTRELLASRATLLSPLGHLHGVTPFRMTSIEEIETRVGNILAVSQISPDATLSEVSRQVEATLQLEVLSQLNRIDPKLCDLVEFVSARLAPGHDAVERITHQLNGRAGMSPESLGRQLDLFGVEYRGPIKDILTRHAQVHSHISLGRDARVHGEMIRSLAADRGVDIEDIAIHCPERNKSFSMYGLIFREANAEFPTGSFTTPANLDGWLAVRGDRPRLVVVIDDIAGSGESLRRTVVPIVNHGVDRGDIVLSPLIASTEAERLIREAPVSRDCIVAPVSVKPRLIDEGAFVEGSPQLQLSHRAVLGSLGFHESGTMVALPYMSPDNNVDLFARCFAEFYTLHEGAVRGRLTGAQGFARYRNQPPFDVVLMEARERLTDARFIAGHLPTLRGLVEHEEQLDLYWKGLPATICETLAEEWATTKQAICVEREVVIYGELKSMADILDSSIASSKDRARVSAEFVVLSQIAAGLELKEETRYAIAAFALKAQGRSVPRSSPD